MRGERGRPLPIRPQQLPQRLHVALERRRVRGAVEVGVCLGGLGVCVCVDGMGWGGRAVGAGGVCGCVICVCVCV